jgi:hypothetical protein
LEQGHDGEWSRLEDLQTFDADDHQTQTQARVTSSGFLLDATIRRITRRQVQVVRQIFPFLHLPGELRNEVYKYALDDFEGVGKVFESAYNSLMSREPADKPEPYGPPAKVTPAIILINKQIYLEAVGFLYNKTITFNHGLLHVNDVSSVISPHLLRNLTAININDSAHPIMQDEIQCASWYGYNRLFRQMTNILKGGHRLKHLTIEFNDPALGHHVRVCQWHSGSNCDFAKHLAKEMYRMQQIRGIGTVTLKGLNPQLSAKIKTRMESRAIKFFDLPLKARQLIYSHAADWNDASLAFERTLTGWYDPKRAIHTPRRNTPTILRLNSDITREALPILRAKPFTFSLPNDWRFDLSGLTPFDLLTSFITPATLRTITTLNVKIEYWGTLSTSDGDFLSAFAHKSSQLRALQMTFVDRFIPRYVKDREAKLRRFRLAPFAQVRGLEKVVIEGDLPVEIADAIGKVMTSDPAPGEELPRVFWLVKLGCEGGATSWH